MGHPITTEDLGAAGPGGLAEKLAAVAADLRERLAEYTAAVDRAVARLRDSHAAEGVPAAGETFPDFILPDSQGKLWRLAEALQSGPVVLAFHRGLWCDFCQLNMQALAGISPRVQALGGQIVAISPQNAAHAAQLGAETGAEFEILCDMGLSVSTLLGLTYVIDESLHRELSLLEVDLNAANDGDGWIMPITATFVLDAKGVIVARHLDPDPRIRMESDAIVQAVAAAAGQSAARS